MYKIDAHRSQRVRVTPAAGDADRKEGTSVGDNLRAASRQALTGAADSALELSLTIGMGPPAGACKHHSASQVAGKQRTKDG